MALASLLAALAGCGSSPLPLLSTARQVTDLDPDRAALGYPVRLTGVVTFFDARYRVLAVQDESGAVSVEPNALGFRPEAGERVEIVGFSGIYGSAPLVVKPRITRLGAGALPEPRPVSLAQVASGALDYQRVEVRGSVEAVARLDAEHVRFGLLADGVRLDVFLSTEVYLNPLVIGRTVTLRGIPASLRDSRGRPRRTRLYLHDIGQVDAGTLELAAKPMVAPRSGEQPELMTTVARLKALPAAEARRRHPLRLRGVVNHYMPVFGGMYLQDASGGVYVSLRDGVAPPTVPIGSEVEIEGYSDQGDYAPSVIDARVKVLGPGRPFPPVAVDSPGALTMQQENLWGRARGVVRQVRGPIAYGVNLQLEVGHQPLSATISNSAGVSEFAGLVDAEVELDGVLGSQYDRLRRLLGFTLVTPLPRFLRVVRPAIADPFSLPLRTLASLQQFVPGDTTRHRIHVAGTVTSAWQANSIHIAEANSAVELHTAAPVSVRPGQRVEAVGFQSMNGLEAGLHEAVIRTSGEGTPPAPQDVDPEEVFLGTEEARLLRMEGLLVRLERAAGDLVLTLESGRNSFTAELDLPQSDSRLADLREGSLLQLTGVCLVDWNRTVVPAEPHGFRLRLRSPADIHVLERASWWTPTRVTILLTTLAAVLLLALLWAASLRQEVRQQTAVIADRASQAAQLEAQLAQAQRLESVGRLAGGIAHDFNNMLTVINGYSEVLLGDLTLSARARHSISEIAKAGQRAASLTQQMLAFSRRQVLRLEVLDLNHVIKDMTGMLPQLLGASIRVTTSLAPELGLVRADAVQMQQVLMNLAVNARDAMPEGGELSISTANETLAESFQQGDERIEPGDFVTIRVADTGVGMDEDTLTRIFEPFFTTKPVGEGTGLGLSMVFGIVRQCGGHLQVESRPGAGSSFLIRLPRVTEQ